MRSAGTYPSCPCSSPRRVTFRHATQCPSLSTSSRWKWYSSKGVGTLEGNFIEATSQGARQPRGNWAPSGQRGHKWQSQPQQDPYRSSRALHSNPSNLQGSSVDSREIAASYRSCDQAMMSPKLKTPWQCLKHTSWDVVHPYSTLRATWDGWNFLVLAVMTLILPAYISFSVSTSVEMPRAEGLAFFLIDGIFILDILLNFRTAVWHGDHAEGALMWGRREIAMDYLHSWSLVGLLSATPWSALGKFAAFMSPDRATKTTKCAPQHADSVCRCVRVCIQVVSSGVNRTTGHYNSG